MLTFGYVCFGKEINTYKLLHVHGQTLFHQEKCFPTPKLGDSIKSLAAEVLVNSSRRAVNPTLLPQAFCTNTIIIWLFTHNIFTIMFVK